MNKAFEQSKKLIILTILYNLVEGIFALYFGLESNSICDVDKSKDIVRIIARKAKQLGEDSIMIGNSFLSVNEID